VIRDVVNYLASCFYREETWELEDEEDFKEEARRCTEESLKNLYDPNISTLRHYLTGVPLSWQCITVESYLNKDHKGQYTR